MKNEISEVAHLRAENARLSQEVASLKARLAVYEKPSSSGSGPLDASSQAILGRMASAVSAIDEVARVLEGLQERRSVTSSPGKPGSPAGSALKRMSTAPPKGATPPSRLLTPPPASTPPQQQQGVPLGLLGGSWSARSLVDRALEPYDDSLFEPAQNPNPPTTLRNDEIWRASHASEVKIVDLRGEERWAAKNDSRKLNEVPEEITDCFMTEVVFLGGNRLTRARGVDKLVALKMLDLSDNQLTELPPEVQMLPRLQRIDLFKNQIKLKDGDALPETVQAANFFNNKITKVPSSVLSSLASLTDINLSSNKLFALPDFSMTSRSLVKISAFWNNIVMVPRLSTLTCLEEVNLSDNKIEEMPAVAGLAKLKVLNLGKNRIPELPDGCLDGCDSLEELLISKNLLTSLTVALPASLRKLQIADNQLTGLPRSLPTLKALVTLDAGGNQQATQLPSSFPSSLENLLLSGCSAMDTESVAALVVRHCPKAARVNVSGLKGSARPDTHQRLQATCTQNQGKLTD